MKEIAISKACRMEIEYDIHNGLFSADYEITTKWYSDEENELVVEVRSECLHRSQWQLDIYVTDRYGDEYLLAEGQWSKLYQALMGDVEWRCREAESEAEYIKQLWMSAYA